MSVRIRIGVADASQALEVDVEEAEDIINQLEQAFSSGEQLLRFLDIDGRLIVVPLDKLGFVEVEPSKPRMVGFVRSKESGES